MKITSSLLDSSGTPISYEFNVPARVVQQDFRPEKQAMGLYGNIYAYPNYGKYRPRYYSWSDTSVGLDKMSLELVKRWSREMFSQLPFISVAIRTLANFAISDSYLPIYTGKDKEWWQEAEEWLLNDFYPNCNVRGSHFDFRTSLRLESQLIDVDGDFLLVYGEEDNFPKFQIIPSNRICANLNDNTEVKEGKMKGTILSDGVYYTPQGKPVAYHVRNASNLVNLTTSQLNQDQIYSTRDAHLILDPLYFDKLRGVPSIGSAILQSLSVQQLDELLMEKIKIQSSVAFVESNPRGETPVEYQNTLAKLLEQGNVEGQAGAISPNLHALKVVQGSGIRYVHAEGGEIKPLDSHDPGNETMDYVERLETQILSTIGVPHTLVFSTDKVSGRVTSAVAEMFRSAIKRRQAIMDKSAKFRVAWALSKAMDKGFISRNNNNENLAKVVEFTKPKMFSLDAKYDSAIVIDQYESGFSSLNDATTQLYNKTAEATLDEQASEQVMFYKRAKQVAEATGVDLNTVISGWRLNQKVTRPPEAADTTPNNPDSPEK